MLTPRLPPAVRCAPYTGGHRPDAPAPMKLIGSNTSPYVRKVRIVMAEKHIDCQYVQDDVWAADTRIQDANPLGKVPALLLDDGTAVYDSRVIAEYLDSLAPVQRLIPPAGRARLQVRTLEALADGMLDAAVLLRLESIQRTEAQRSAAWIARQQDKIERGLHALAGALGDQPWLSEAKFSLADIAAGCALGYLDFRFPERDWRAAHPNLMKLAERLQARASFVSTAPPAP